MLRKTEKTQSSEVRRLKRLMKTINDDRVDNMSVLIEFQGSALP